jgi:hypothetical protein
MVTNMVVRSLNDLHVPASTPAPVETPRTRQRARWREARAHGHLSARQRAPNCRIVNAIVEETNPAEDEESLALVREALREQDQRQERQAWEGLGFGGVMRPEPQASASKRQEPTASGRVHASRK